MSAALVLAAVVASAMGPAPHQGGRTAQLVRDACIDTQLERAAFEQLGRERGWQRARITSDTRRPGGWTLVFRAGDARVMLSQVPGFGPGDAELGSVCTVSVERASDSLEQEVAAFAASLGLESEGPIANLPAGAAPFRTWSLLGDWTLTYAAAADGRAAISLSRQIVISDTAPASPPGN